MRWKQRPIEPWPKIGETRTIRRFLFLPKLINGEGRWLEWAWIRQQYQLSPSLIPESAFIVDVEGWVDVDWAESPSVALSKAMAESIERATELMGGPDKPDTEAMCAGSKKTGENPKPEGVRPEPPPAPPRPSPLKRCRTCGEYFETFTADGGQCRNCYTIRTFG